MKNIILITFVLVYSTSFSQKIEFGVSYTAGINFTGKDQTIEMLNEGKTYPYEPHSIRPRSIWNTQHIQFDVYPTQLKGFSASVGLRMFTFGWEIDTVSAGHASPTTGEWLNFYARRESKFGYILPTINITYEYSLVKDLKMRHSVSFGLFSFVKKRKQYSYAYDENGEGVFEYIDSGLRDGYNSINFETDVRDFQISSELVYSFKGLSVSIGPALYYLTGDFVDHFSFQVKGGIGYRFSRKEK
jgi:hypothetical protein